MHLARIDKQCTFCLEVFCIFFHCFQNFAYSGNTLKVSIFCIFWQFFESFNILHYLAVLWKSQYFAYSGSALKASTIWVQKNPSVARDLCPCEINFHILAATHLLFFSCILLYWSISRYFLMKSFFSILLLSIFYFLLGQTFLFCAIGEEQSAVKQCAWGEKKLVQSKCALFCRKIYN